MASESKTKIVVSDQRLTVILIYRAVRMFEVSELCKHWQSQRKLKIIAKKKMNK